MTRTRGIAALIALHFVGCADAPTSVATDDPAIDALSTGDTAAAIEGIDAVDFVPLDLPEVVFDDLSHGIPARVLVRLNTEPRSEYPMSDPRRLAEFAARWPDVVADFESTLPQAAFVSKAYRNLPVIALEVDTLDAAYALLDHPDLYSIEEDVIHTTSDTSSLAHIGQPAAAARGFTGDGTTVVVLDTGLDYRHADFGCTAPGVPANCPVVAAFDTAPEDGRLDESGRHGTNVAAIVGAVAPGADLIGIDVFTGPNSASTIDILEGIDWAVENQATYNIASINMSLGAGAYTRTCSGSAFDASIAAARAAGISVVVASGNNSYRNAIASPACAPGALSVGAVLDETYGGFDCTGRTPAPDSVACFSNSASFLDILAPGVNVDGGGVTLTGTSMASPHVAGAMAVLRAADPNATVDELERQLLDAGVQVTDRRNGLTFPRLDLDAAVEGQACTFTVNPTSLAPDPLGQSGSITVTTGNDCTFDVSSDQAWLEVSPESGTRSTTLSWSALPNAGFARTATLTVGPVSIPVNQGAGASPTGGVIIENDAAITNLSRVNLTLNAPGSDRMCISNNADSCVRWEPYNTTKTWRMSARTSGVVTVYAWFESAGVVGQRVSDTIEYDRRPPNGGTLTTSGALEGITLSWDGFEDDYSGIVSYKLVQAEGRQAPPSRCTNSTPIYEGNATSVLVSGIQGEYSWRVCPVDRAGNVGGGLTATFTTRPEYTGPTGTVQLENGAPFTNQTTLTATLSAQDASGVTHMCLSTTDVCTRYVPFANTATLRIRGDGVQTANAWFRDAHGNVGGPFSDSITAERTPPVDGSVTATVAPQSITLTPTGFSDATSGIAKYIVMSSTTGRDPGRRCISGDKVYEGAATPITLTGLTDGQAYRLRVCAVDGAGNVSSGVVGVATPVPESTGPTGGIDIANGARYTRESRVTAALTANDPSGVTEMCVTTTLPCRRFSPFAPTVDVSLRAGDTTVYAQFRDAWGNESEVYTDVIGLDRQSPEDGTVSVVVGDGSLQLSFDGFTDAMSGVAKYHVYKSETRPPRSCRGEADWIGSTPSVTFSSLTNGNTYEFLVCAEDAVGNVSRRGVRGSYIPAPETNRPTGTVVVNNGAEWTNSRRVTLSLTASDDSGVARMCAAAGDVTECTRYVDFAETYTRLSIRGSGQLPVRVWFQDVWGNVSETYAEDTIGVDLDRPVDGTIAATASGSNVTLTWSGFSDPTSGLSSYIVRVREGRAPSNCRTGDLVYEGSDTSASITLQPSKDYGFRVCAKDVAGNESRGVFTTVTLP